MTGILMASGGGSQTTPAVAGVDRFTESGSLIVPQTINSIRFLIDDVMGTSSELNVTTIHTNISSENSPILTAECWIRPSAASVATSGFSQTIFGQEQTSQSDFQYQVYLINGYIQAKVRTTTATITLSASKIKCAPDVWTHIAFSTDGTNVWLYQGGTLIDSSAISGIIAYFAADKFVVGRNLNDVYVSNLRVVSYAVEPLYYSSVRNNFSKTFIPSGEPLRPLSWYTSDYQTSSTRDMPTTSILMCQHDRFIDNSGFNHTITGNAFNSELSPFANTTPQPSWSSSFRSYITNGPTAQYLSVNSINYFATDGLRTGDFTAELWFYPTTTASTTPSPNTYSQFGSHICGIFQQNSPFRNLFTINHGTDDKIYFIFWNNSTSSNVSISSNQRVILNTWNHVAVVRRSNTIKIYLNGMEGQSISGTYDLLYTDGGASTFYIGSKGDYGATFNGHISDVRIVKNNGLYSGNFILSRYPLKNVAGTILLTCQTPRRVIDRSNNAFTVGSLRESRTTNFTPYSSSALTNNWSCSFNGTSDRLSFTNNSAYLIGSSDDFTIECWYYLTANPTEITPLATTWNANISSGYTNRWCLGFNANRLYWWDSTGTSGIQDSTTAALNTWTHVAVVRKNSTITMYKNGVVIGTQTANQSYTTDGTLSIGFVEASSYLNGYISNLRIVKGTAVYLKAFTPSTIPLQVITGTSLLTCNSSLLIDNANAVTMTPSGSPIPVQISPFNLPTVNTTDVEYVIVGGGGGGGATAIGSGGGGGGGVLTGTTSITPGTKSVVVGVGGAASVDGGFSSLDLEKTFAANFNGSASYLSLPSDSEYAAGSKDFTIECWIYISSLSNFAICQSSILSDNSAGKFSFTYVAGTKLLTFQTHASTGNQLVVTCSWTPFTGAWYHVCVNRKNNDYTIYINGIAQSVTASGVSTSAATNLGQNGFIIGAAQTSLYLNGIISCFRYTVGTALYQTNFVPAFPLTANITTKILTAQDSLSSGAFADFSNLQATITTVGNVTKLSTSVYKALGGGYGGNQYQWSVGQSGNSGASGGGGSSQYYTSYVGGSGLPGQGFSGANGIQYSDSSYVGGGGGGAGAAATSRSGGVGRYISSLDARFGGGGGGGVTRSPYSSVSSIKTPSPGGLGGGGDGYYSGGADVVGGTVVNTSSVPAVNGAPGTGGGGGGGGGLGGSGVVIVRYINKIIDTLFDKPGTYTYVVPDGVYVVSVVCVGGGSGGQTSTNAWNANGQSSSFGTQSELLNDQVIANGGSGIGSSGTGGTFTPGIGGVGGGGFGGKGADGSPFVSPTRGGFGGGAGGYKGNAGNSTSFMTNSYANGGGGVGIYGIGPTASGAAAGSGAGGQQTPGSYGENILGNGRGGMFGGGGGGFAGSGGAGAGLGWRNDIAVRPGQKITVTVGNGGGRTLFYKSTQDGYALGSWGAVRIISGSGRSFPDSANATVISVTETCVIPSVETVTPNIFYSGVPYTGSITVRNATTASVDSASLPAGISVTTTTTSGTDIIINLYGIPSASVGTTTTFRINATNACVDGIETTITNSSAGTATIATPPSCAAPTIQTISPNAFLSGQPYTGTITVQNVTSINSITGLPAGLSWTAPSSAPKSLLFSGSNYLSIPFNSSFNHGTNDFTFEAWVDPTASTGINCIYSVTAGVSTSARMIIMLDNRVPKIFFDGLTGGNALYNVATSALTVNRWAHIAYVRRNSAWTWYINGIASGSGSNTTTITFGGVQSAYIGTGAQAGWPAFNGNIYSLRIVGSAVYTTNFATPVGDLTAISGTRLLTAIGNTISDLSTNNLSITNTGTVVVANNSPNTIANYVINVTGTPTAPAFTPYSISISADNDCRTGSFTTTTGPAGSGAIGSCDQPTFGELYPNVIEQNVPYVGTLRVLDSVSASVSNLPSGLTATGTAYVQRSWSFPGNTYLTAPNNAGHQFGSTPFTVEGWIYANVIQTSGIIGNFQLGGSGWRIVLGSTGIISYYQSNGGDASGTSAIAIKAHSWNHFAVVGNGTTIRIYVNGEEGSVTCAQSAGITSGGVLRIGRNSDTSGGVTWVFNGIISNLRIVKGTAVYTSNFVPPSGPLTAISGTTLLAFNGETLTDASGTMTLTAETGTPTLNMHGPYMPSNAWFFDGTNDALSIASATALRLETLSSYTIEFWMYVMNGSNRQQIIGNRPASANQGWFVSVGVTANKISFSHTGGTGVTSTGNIVSSAWNHIAICRNGSSMTIFINGVLDSTNSISNGTSSTWPVLIGMSGESGTPRPYYGYLSNIRISNTAIYSSNFTPTRYSLPVTSQTVLLTCNNNSLADSSSYNFVITKSGTVLPDEIGSQSVLFNGSSYLSAVIPTLGTGDFTVECWVNLTNSSENRGVWQISTTAGGLQANTNGLMLQVFNNAWYLHVNNGNPGPFTGVSINTWYHTVIMRKSGVTTFSVNGTTLTTLNDTNNYGGNIAIGGGFSTSFLSKSYISNLRVIKGTAIYASTFTPPTMPLIPITGTTLLTCNGHTRMNVPMDSGGGSVAITTAAGTPILSDFSPFRTTRYVFNITGTPTSISGTSFTATNNSACSSANISKQIAFTQPEAPKPPAALAGSELDCALLDYISQPVTSFDDILTLTTNDVSWTGTGGQVNVTTYGATGNNSQSSATANSTAISAAIAACPSGGTVYFPAGTYFISTSFNIPSNIRLLGAEIGQSIIKLNSSYSPTSSIYYTSGATGVAGTYVGSNICIENLVFDGNNNPNRTEQLLGFLQIDGVKIIKCGFINNTYITVAFAGCRNIDIWGSKFANNGKPRPNTTSTPALFVGGVNNFAGANKNINVNKCVFRNNNWSASYFIPDGGSVRNCLFVNNGESTIFANNDTNNVVFENNYFYGATRANISASGLELGGSNFVIRNNFFRNNGSDGLSLTNVKTALVEYNTFYNNGQETTYPSFQYASGIGIATINDSFYQGTTQFSNNITVKFNKFVNVGGLTQQSAISFYRNKDLLVENTTVTDNSTFNHPRDTFNNLNNNSYNPATTVFNNNDNNFQSTVNGAYVVSAVQDFICSGLILDPNIVTVTGTSDLDGPANPNVWGSGPYTSDSDVARAAVHAGLIQRGETALIKKVIGPMLTNYVGSTANGVTTSSYSPQWESMTLVKIS